MTEPFGSLQEEVARRKQAEEEVRSLDAKLKQSNDGMAVVHRQLQETQSIQKAILDGIPDLVWLKDRESRYIAVNRPFGLACGVVPEDLTGKTDLDIWPRELAERYREDDRQVMESGRKKRVEEPLCDSQGRRTWIETIKVPVTDGRGQVIGTVGITRDITDRKLAADVLNRSHEESEERERERTAELEKANADLRSEIAEHKRKEEELQQSQDLLSNVLKNFPSGVWILDANGNVLEGNRAGLQIWGGAINVGTEQYGKRKGWWLDTHKPITPEEWGSARALQRGESSIEEEIEIECFDGTRKIILNSAMPLRDERGKVTGVFAVNSDVTERKLMEKKLYDLKELLLDAQEIARLGYYIFDVATGTWTSSEVFDAVFGIGGDSRRDFEGWSLLVHPEERQSMREYFLDDVLGKKKPFDCEYRIVRPSDQCIRWVHGLGKVEYDSSGKPVKVIGTIQDITGKKQAEEEKRKLEHHFHQAQKLESLGVLAGGIAHDFNNLLMVVLGNAELAIDELPQMSPARLNLSEIMIAARRASYLSQQMLAYAGMSSFIKEKVELRELVVEMTSLLKTIISKKVLLNLNLERGLPPIHADPSQIRKVLKNLIVNASEAIGDRDGVITVSVSATRCDEENLQKTEPREALTPGLYVHLEVSDTGIGMDTETLSHIFEPFFSTKFTGRGLGLAAVQGIVRVHRGALKVYSEPGNGTTFKIFLPAMEASAGGARPSEPSPLAEWRGQGTILLVEDEKSLIALVTRMLEHLGFTVLTSADGLHAVDLYRERGKEIDLVLMDLSMPHMDGVEAFGELRHLNPDVRVVLASGYSKEDVVSRFAGKGPAGIMQKPYTLARLRETLSGLMPTRPDGEG